MQIKDKRLKTKANTGDRVAGPYTIQAFALFNPKAIKSPVLVYQDGAFAL
jgi:hypothetical protein